MFTNGGAFKFDTPTLDVGTYEAEVRRASSDVANQHELAVFEISSESLAMLCHPGVEGGQRLLEQGQFLESSLPGGFNRQFARFLVERGRHGQHDFLIFKPLFGIR